MGRTQAEGGAGAGETSYRGLEGTALSPNGTDEGTGLMPYSGSLGFLRKPGWEHPLPTPCPSSG